MMVALVFVLSILIGVSLGLLGGGGSILTIPMLLFTTSMDANEAIATSLFVVATTSAVALIAHARAGRVYWRTGLLLGSTSMLAAFVAGRGAAGIPAQILLTLLALLMIAMASAMLRPKRVTHAATDKPPLPQYKAIFYGLILGTITGLVGAGGGFLIVPILVLLGGLPMHNAVATSLLVIAMNTTAGFLGHITHVQLQWGWVCAITAAAVMGSVIGSIYAQRVPQQFLRTAFACLVLATACGLLAQQLPQLLRLIATHA